MPTTLTDLINAIPVVGTGDVISPLTHNSLRDAVVFLASQVAGAPGGQSGALTMSPLFARNEDGPDWNLANGLASQDSEGRSARGAFPIVLPQGARIQNLVVVGRRAGAVTTFSVRLVRVRLADGDPTTVISADLNAAGDPFAVTQGVVSGGDATLAEGLRRVDNNVYAYLIIGLAMGVQNLVQLNGITVSFNQS